MRFLPKVSIVINTDGRAKSLATTLESLRFLRYPNFEVVVVAGPTRDGTHELCESWGDAIKYGLCPVRNLSQSRNIGIAMASGDIVAYIDDDAVPEPEWLDDVVPAFADPGVGVAGGFLHDHTGKTYQWTYGTANRFGAADRTWTRPAPEFNFPQSFNFPHVIGANSIFRRSALLEVGGFDEEFEYFLDETDVTVRVVDAGYSVAQLDRAFVHHKFMPSHIRNQAKVLTSWYSVIKNKAYFALVNGANHAPFETLLEEVQKTVTELRQTTQWAIGEKILTDADLARFEDEAGRAVRDGLIRGRSGHRKFRGPAFWREHAQPFRLFEPTTPAQDQRCWVLLTRSYPPEKVGGVGRYIHQLARTLALRGHQVHVLTAGQDHDTVDFEEGVWVHRIVVRHHRKPEDEALRAIPSHIWDHSRTLLDEALEIASRRRIDAVYAPIWDTEGVAFLGHEAFPLVTSLQTTLRFYLESNPHLKQDAGFMRDFAEPMLAIERHVLATSDGIHAISDAIVEEIEEAYGFRFDRERLWTVPLGLEDWTRSTPSDAAPGTAPARTRISFIGRLESRKGIDVVSEIAPALLRAHPDVELEFVGNDQIRAEDGRTWRERFEQQPGYDAVRDRVSFRGEVGDEELRDAYRRADIVLAPSRFESFGLVHLEANMYGKPVVGGRVGGMVEVVEDGVTGLLAEPGDPASLLQALTRLIGDPALRERMGAAGRARYLARFTPERMADGVEAIFGAVAARRAASTASAASVEPGHPRKLRIAVIGSILVPYDAIGNDLVRMVGFLEAMPGCEVSVLTGHNSRKDIRAKVVPRLADLLASPEFLQADLVIYHFGIYYPLFDALAIGNGHARQAVVFHNITPPELAPPAAQDVIAKSFAQLDHLRAADAIWPVSRENAEMLQARGFDRSAMSIQPLAVDRPARRRLRDKGASEAVRLLFLGRIVPSKGLHDLVEALAQLGPEAGRVQLTVVGDLHAAEPAYRESLQSRIAALGLKGRVEFAGAISDEARDRLLADSQVLAAPSYHEGFCVPVIEALRAGMVPVVYAAHNLRYVADGLCVFATPGDIASLAAALTSAVVDVRGVMRDPAGATLRLARGTLRAAEFDAAVDAHVAQFEPQAVAASLRVLVDRLAGR